MSITTKKEAAELLFKVKDDTNIFQNKTEFQVKVLTTPSLFPGTSTLSNLAGYLGISETKYWFKGRILDPKMAHEKFLESPDNASITSNEALNSRLMALHSTIVLSKHGFAGPGFDVGDVIIAEIEPGDNGMLYDLQNMKFKRVEDLNNEASLSSLTEAVSSGISAISSLFEGGTTGTVGGLPLEPGDATTTDDPPAIIGVMKSKGYTVYEDGRVNTVGVRSSNSLAGDFDDVMYLTWVEDDMWNTVSFQITTDPGKEVIMGSPESYAKYYNSAGSAQLQPGQYKDAYIWGEHGVKYTTLVQRGGNVTIWRDNNKNEILDWEASAGGESTGVFGINIHHAGNQDPRQNVGAYSAGCQVFQSYSDWQKALSIWQSSGAEAFTYTLLTWQDFA